MMTIAAASDGASIFQFDDGDCGAAAVFGFGGGALDERMHGKKFAEAPAKRAGAVSVDDADASRSGECRLIDKFVDAARSFFDGAADYIYLVR